MPAAYPRLRQGLLELSDVNRVIDLISADIHRVRILIRAIGLLDILWNVNQDRTRLAGSRDLKGHFQDPTQLPSVMDSNAPFDDRPGHADNINFLKGIVADQTLRHLAGNDHKGDGVIVGIGNPCDRIGRSGPGSHQTDTDSPPCPGIALRLMNKRLLMAGQNQSNIAGLIQLIQNICDHSARIGENGIHALVFHGFDK